MQPQLELNRNEQFECQQCHVKMEHHFMWQHLASAAVHRNNTTSPTTIACLNCHQKILCFLQQHFVKHNCMEVWRNNVTMPPLATDMVIDLEPQNVSATDGTQSSARFGSSNNSEAVTGLPEFGSKNSNVVNLELDSD